MALAKEGGLVIVEREKNVKALANLGLLPSDIPGFIRRLEVCDYVSGPMDDDRGRPEKWWVFSRELCGKPMYIKVALTCGRVLCLSFHQAEFPLPRPFHGRS